MTNWLLRGLVFAAAMVVLRLIQGVLINTWELHPGLISMALLIIFVIAAMAWGFFDGRADATANPDPDRRHDLAMTWLVAGLVAGVVGGAVAWLISLFDKALYVGGLINEVSTFAAFTALLVFVPAIGAVAVGRRIVDGKHANVPQRHHGLAAHDDAQADTDVFAAVSVGAEPTAPVDTGVATSAAPAALGGPAPAAGWTTEEFPLDADETTTNISESASESDSESADDTTTGIATEDPRSGDQPS